MMLNGWGYLNYKREFVPVYCFWRSEYDFDTQWLFYSSEGSLNGLSR